MSLLASARLHTNYYYRYVPNNGIKIENTDHLQEGEPIIK